MPASYSPAALRARLAGHGGGKDPRILVRVVLGVLVLANIVAALMLFRPWGGSADEAGRQLDDLRRQLLQQQARLARTKALVSKVEQARREGDGFLGRYTLPRRTAYSAIVRELDRAAQQAGVRRKEEALVLEPIEGSDSLSMMTITSGYEGAYPNLTKLVNLLDRSSRFLIIETMTAAPQQSGALLNVTMKLNAFVKEQPGGAL